MHAELNLWMAKPNKLRIIAQMFNECGIKFHQYADDIQLYSVHESELGRHL